jgi:diguanylate cyclase (GGDEF)-like protein
MASTGYELEPVLRTVARTTAACLGFGTAVINLYRPAWDDFETVVVEGNEEARRLLLGQCSTTEDWAPLLDERFLRRGAYVLHGFDWSQDSMATYVPPIEASSDPDRWQPDDALFVALRSSAGELLGILSVDEPASGKRPRDDELDLLVGVAAHAALALEHVQQAAAAERQRVSVDHLLRLTASLAERRTIDEMLEAVCTGVSDALGFQKVVLGLANERDVFDLRAHRGMPAEELERLDGTPVDAIAPILDPSLEREGVIFIGREDAEARVDPALRDATYSRNNGRGARAWDNHVLIVPLRDREGRLEGALWADDPADRLLPTPEMLRALRAFANHAMTAVESARQLELMRHLAEHDPLTGLRNRRGLQEHIDAEIARTGSVAVIVCDLDNFKRVNDALGYVQGDEALRRFAGVLSEAGGLAARLGGEEFALVFAGRAEDEAIAIAERLRAAVPAAFADFPWPLTTSIGVAVSGPGAETASLLLRAATRAVFGAKRLGRDRCVAYHAEALEALLGSLEDDGGAGNEQLAAAMLLAETLDLRDVSTARHSQTVGRYAEGIARTLGLSEERVQRIRAAGVLHDVGKLGVADAVLQKPGPLTDEEWADMRRHPELGARILEHANLRDISGWVLAHHERVDGRGYPHGLAGEAIPLEARILAVADAYEAMTADRPYRAALGHDAARTELQACAGAQFDPDVVDAFLRALAPSVRRRGANVPIRLV